mmetsp:Transcript_24493/g.36563  ORF Transcript_24493/g.36563 Transcript_24493/m.36563 type:complete len:122 (-) Transcript_24493:61-426(-)
MNAAASIPLSTNSTLIIPSNHCRRHLPTCSSSLSLKSASTSTGIGSTAISSIAPNATPSSSLLPKSKSEITTADGLNIIWNLTMPNCSEHILTCGLPLLESKFHPTEGRVGIVCHGCQIGL